MNRRNGLAAALGGAGLAVAIFAVGGALRGAEAAAAVLVAAALAVQVAARSQLERVSPLRLFLGLATAVTAAQLLPLPAALVEAVEPVGAALRVEGAQLAGVSVASTLSLDVPGTLRALVFFLTLFALAELALRVAVNERGRYLVLSSVALLCGLAAVVTGVHELLNLDRLYGVYKPEHATPSVLGPLLNENQLGCLMALGAVVSLGLTMYTRQRSWKRAMWLVCLTACAVATMASHSRGATLALFAGLIVAAGVLIGQRVARPVTAQRSRKRLRAHSLPIAIVSAGVVIVVVYASAGGITHELSRTSTRELDGPNSKYATWRSAQSLIAETPWVGVGRGAFEPVFTRIHPASAFSTFSHLENEYLQAVVDWGIPAALALGVAALWLVIVAARKWRDGPLAAGGLGALAVVALQSNVDFGLEIPGLALPITAIVATLTYVPLREANGRALLISRGLRALVAIAVVAAAGTLLTDATLSLDDDHEAVRARPETLAARLHPMIARHPLDYYGYALAAQLAIHDHADTALPLLNHAMTLHPTFPGLHLMAARLLYGNHKSQAAMEYAAAVRNTMDPTPVINEIVANYAAAPAADAIPVDAQPPGDIVRAIEAAGHPDAAVAWLARVLEVRPGNATVCEMLYDRALKRGDLAAVDVTRKHCVDFQPSPTSQLQLAQVLIQHKQLPEAIALLKDVEDWRSRSDIKATAWFALCDAYMAQQAWLDARHCLRRLDVSGNVPAALANEIPSRLEAIDAALKRAPSTGSAAPP